MQRSIQVTCPQHGSFDSGADLEEGASATFEHSVTMCPVGPHPVPIPDGTYTNGPFGITLA